MRDVCMLFVGGECVMALPKAFHVGDTKALGLILSTTISQTWAVVWGLMEINKISKAKRYVIYLYLQGKEERKDRAPSSCTGH